MKYKQKPAGKSNVNNSEYLVEGAPLACSGEAYFRFSPPDRGIKIGSKDVGLASDTKKENFIFLGHGPSICAYTGERCTKDFLPTWMDPVESVVYGADASLEEKQGWVRGRGQYTDSAQYATLDTYSVLYCTNGGVVRATSSGQEAEEIRSIDVSMDEKIHVIIAKRNDTSNKIHNGDSLDPVTVVNETVLSAIGLDDGLGNVENLRVTGTNNIIKKNTSPLRLYDRFFKHQYEYDYGSVATLFLPFVFQDANGGNLSTTREVISIHKTNNPTATYYELQVLEADYEQAKVDYYNSYALKMVQLAKKSAENAGNLYKDWAKALNEVSQNLKKFKKENIPLPTDHESLAMSKERQWTDAKSARLNKLTEIVGEVSTDLAAAKSAADSAMEAYYSALYELSDIKASGQKDSERKLALLTQQSETAQKLAYMIKHGPDAKSQYDTDRGTSLTPANLRSESNYGLWGQYYSPENGWHRGVDVAPGGDVHAICSGIVIGRSSWYVSIYNGINTYTYMHLNQSLVLEEEVEQWQNIGTEGSNSPAVSMSAHTHLEINRGRSTSFGRPWVNGEMGNIKMSEVIAGDNFSLNPYSFIDEAWGELNDE